MTFFKNIEDWFKKVFKNVPAWNVIALSALNVAAPLIETVLALADPAAAAVVTPIFTAIQADLGTVSQVLATGSTTNLASLLNSVKANLPALLTAAHITDVASVEKANAAVAAITSELEVILAAIPTAA